MTVMVAQVLDGSAEPKVECVLIFDSIHLSFAFFTSMIVPTPATLTQS
jgi:hypothetical protein